MAVIESKRSSARTQPANPKPAKHRSAKRAIANRKLSKPKAVKPHGRRIPSLPKLVAARPPSAAMTDAAFTVLKKPRASPWTTLNSSPPANTTALMSVFRTKLSCTLLLSPASPWKPSTPTGRPETGVASRNGVSSAAPHCIPESARRLASYSPCRVAHPSRFF
jgi:hypothetical protein